MNMNWRGVEHCRGRIVVVLVYRLFTETAQGYRSEAD